MINDTERLIEPDTTTSPPSYHNTLTIEVLAITESEAESDQAARLIEQDLDLCLAGFTMAGALDGWMECAPTRSALLMEQHDQVTAAVKATIEIQYQTTFTPV